MTTVKGLPMGRLVRRAGVALVAALTLSSCAWQGIANVPLPGGPGSGSDKMTLVVQMPDTLALNVNSRVRVADVFVGSVRSIELKNWVATLTLDIQPGLTLPTNTIAYIGQTSLLGSQHVQLDRPADPTGELKSGDTIAMRDSADCRPEGMPVESPPKSYPCTSSFPSTERTLASIGTILSGGGIPNLETIQTEIANVLTGRGDQIREFLGRLDTFTAALNDQRQDITRAIDSTNRLLAIIASRNDTLDRVLTEFPPLIKHFADTRDLFADAVTALGRISKATDDALSAANPDITTNLKNLQRPLVQLSKASPYLLGALKVIGTAPFSITNVPKAIRGDYINVSLNVDLTLSALDNGVLSGTGVSGMLRALEQSWGRDPNTMIPDVRFTPNPHNAPGGPLVERGE